MQINANHDGRTSLIKKNVLYSFLIKGWGAFIIFLSVPVTLKCLGEYSNGVWLTISSLLVWIDQMDIGLGNGLRNKLAIFMAENNYVKAREAVSSTFFMLIFIIVPIAIVLCALINFSDVYAFFNVKKEIINDLCTVLTVATIFVCTTFIFKFVGSFYLGLQLPAINNLLVVCGQTLSLIGTILLYYFGSHSLFHIAVVNTFPPLLIYLISCYYTFNYRYKILCPSFSHVKIGMVKELLSFGVKFFVLQMSGGILFLSSNILISRLFSPEVVTPYQITYRYFSVVLLVFTIICTPFWTATTDAYEKNDIKWLKNSNRYLNKLILLVVCAIVFMVIISPLFYKIWIGTDVIIPIGMTIMMALFMGITICSLRYSYILNGLSVLNLQLITTLAAAVLFIPLSITVSHLTHNIIYFLGIMCVVNLPGLILNRIQYKKIMSKTASGIWKK